MNRVKNRLMIAALCAGALAFVEAPRAAAQNGSVSGTILDVNAKPWAGLTIQVVGEQGQKQEAKTDNDGKYSVHNLRPGVYSVTVTSFPPPNDKQPPYEMAKIRVGSGEDQKADANFKDILAKQGSAAQEQVKKQNEERQKFQSMKQHFDAGIGFLGQANQTKADLGKAPADQRDALKAQVKDYSDKAVTELEAAKSAASEKDSNLNLIWARLGDAYDADGRPDDAINAYKQAIELKPTPAYYNNLGGIYGRNNKIQEAMGAFSKSAELDPANAAGAYRNAGITLYNAGKMKEAAEPLKKATELDPKNAQAWRLLGAALVGSIDSTKDCKVEKDKMDCKIPDGTVQAFQKAVELDPNGPEGQLAKEGLAGLEAISSGIQTKVGGKKKKS